MPRTVRTLGVVAAALASWSLAGCTAEDARRGADDRSPARVAPRDLSDCPPVRRDDVRGRAPDYLPRALSSFSLRDAVCAAAWAPRLEAGFTPQGLAVHDGEAWVGGYDLTAPGGERWCWVLRVDLSSGRLLQEQRTLTATVPGGDTVSCRHGGGPTTSRAGLWMTEKARLWLLDASTLQPLRVWRLDHPVRGSFAVIDGETRLGIGAFRGADVGRSVGSLYWYDVSTLLASGDRVLTAGRATSSRPLPPLAQRAVWGSPGPGQREGLWVALSHTTCGVLAGPGGRIAFVPGAEGVAVAGGPNLWVASESTAREYFERGGRPVVPSLVRLDTSRMDRWPRPECEH